MNVFAPCILGNKSPALIRIDIYRKIWNENDKVQKKDIPWPDPQIGENIPQELENEIMTIYRTIEKYFKGYYQDANIEDPEFLLKFAPDFSKEDIEKYQKRVFTDSATSISLGIFLAAAIAIIDYDVKDRWKSITATGTFKEKLSDENLIPTAIYDADVKFDAFEKYANDEKNKCGDGIYHLFLYVSDETGWEREKKIKNNKGIIVQSFSPKKDTIFDILDFVFNISVPKLPKGLIKEIEEKQERGKYFRDFEGKTKKYITEQIRIDPPMFNNRTYSDISDKLENNHLLIHGPYGIGKSNFAIQLARYMVWNRTIYAPIWIKNKTKPNDAIETQYQMFLDELFWFFDDKDEINCIKILKDIPFLIIIDDLPEQSLDNFLDRMMEFSSKIKKNSRIIFISTKMYNKERIKYLNDFAFQRGIKDSEVDDKINLEPVPVSIPNEQIHIIPSKRLKIQSVIRKVLMGVAGFAILGLILFLLFSFFHKPDTPNNDTGEHPKYATPLTDDQWEDGGFTELIDEAVYTFSVTNGQEYYLWLNDHFRGEGTGTLSARAIIYYNNRDMLIISIVPSLDNPTSFIARSDGRVDVRLFSYQGYTGTYSIKYSTDRIKPDQKNFSDSTPLTANQRINNNIADSTIRQDLMPSSVPLTDGEFVNGSITESVKVVWYSFFVKSGTKYYIWKDQSDASISVDVFYCNEDEILDQIFIYPSWDRPGSFTSSSTGTAYIKVYISYDGTGSYRIAYSTDRIRPEWELPPSYIRLKDGDWEYGDITESVKEVWYSFWVEEGTEYNFWWDDQHQGDGTKKLLLDASAFYRNGDFFDIEIKSLWDRPRSFTASSTDWVFIRVYPFGSYEEGDYGIAYSTDRIRPHWESPPSYTMLEKGVWKDEHTTLPLRGGVWYSFRVDSDTPYFIWLNHRYGGDGTKNAYIEISIFYDNGEYIDPYFQSTNILRSFVASSTREVYIKVFPMMGGPQMFDGTYSIMYSTDANWPWSENQ
jgi:DNA polymerase III delta prime subunit